MARNYGDLRRISLALILLLRIALAANLPPNGCHVQAVCSRLHTFRDVNITEGNFRNHTLIGRLKGRFNSQGGRFKPHEAGSGPLNLEVFQDVGNHVDIVRGASGGTLESCCRACSGSNACHAYHFFHSRRLADNANVRGFIDGVQCYLLARNAGSGWTAGRRHPYSGDGREQGAMAAYFPLSWVGGSCDTSRLHNNDPHITGTHGTLFDFPGQLGKSFCLLSDRRIHVNVLLQSHQAPESAAAAALAAAGMPRRVARASLNAWVKEVGVVWVSSAGKQHSLRMVARKGNQQERGTNGFLALLQVDGADVAVPPSLGGMPVVAADGSVVIRKVEEDEDGPFDVDTYEIALEGLGKVYVTMRVAHPVLQTPEEAEAHFAIRLAEFKTTSASRGVLGQALNKVNLDDRGTLRYDHLSELLHHPIAGISTSRRSSLHGADYVTPSILSTGVGVH
ncbi:hypothetical protein CLOM_g19976 [Closterium sp. NIES-68]|nr:hypothetical protein CLOM_g19976 [Closterium sp. NIES-68]GJP67168.1 hypothetical protein CLOP_g24027 [Closterium sp. NIES-67]